VKKLIARFRARFVFWLLPDIEGHLIIRSMNFNKRSVGPESKYRDPAEFIYPRLYPEGYSDPFIKKKSPGTKSGLPAPRVPYQHLQ